MIVEIWDGVDLGRECSRFGDLHMQRLGQIRNEEMQTVWSAGNKVRGEAEMRCEKQAQVRTGRSEGQKLLGSDLTKFTFLDNPMGRKIILSAGCLF